MHMDAALLGAWEETANHIFLYMFVRNQGQVNENNFHL